MNAERKNLLEEEIIIVRNSGEIPEIALHTSLFFLTEDEDGPQINLQQDELSALYEAAIDRAREIVLRDLNPANRDLPVYRGLKRSIVNWHRLQKLCNRIGRRCYGFRETVSEALIAFLENELSDVESGARTSSVNCSATDLEGYCTELRLDLSRLPEGWTALCWK